MNRRFLLWGWLVAAGCASTSLHDGRTTLRKDEHGYLVARKGAPKSSFERFWRTPRPASIGIVQWQEEQGWACPQAPADLLQAIRDELGRLNQQYRAGENISLAVTVYRFDKGAILRKPTAHYELVARDPRGQVVWAADDKIEATENLSRSLADTSSAMISREVLRKVREQLGI
jgi:hypothetical protein